MGKKKRNIIGDITATSGASMVGLSTMSRIENANPATGSIARSGRQGLRMASAGMVGTTGLGVVDEIGSRMDEAVKKTRKKR